MGSFTFKKFSLGLALLILASLLISCGDTAAPTASSKVATKNKPLEVWIVDWTDETQQLFKEKIVPGFAAKYPGLSVNVVWKDWETYDTDIATAYSLGSAPDVLQFGAEYAWQVATRKQAISLDDRLEKWGQLNDFYSSALDAMRWQGKIYGLPHLTAPRTYFYRGEILQEKGITKTPVTWEDFMTALPSTNVVEGGRLQRQAFPVYNVQIAHEFIQLMYTAGGQLIGSDCKSAFNSPTGQVAAQFLVDRYQAVIPKGVTSLAESSTSQFAQGNLVSIYSNTKLSTKPLSQFAPDKLPQMLVGDPIVPGNVTYKTTGQVKPKSLIFTDWLAISTQSKQVDDAWNFLLYLMDAQNLYDYNKTLYFFPPRKSAFNLGGYLKESSNEKTAAIMDKYGLAFPSFPDSGRFRQIMTDQLLAAMKGEVSVATALDKAATDYNTILAKSNFCA